MHVGIMKEHHVAVSLFATVFCLQACFGHEHVLMTIILFGVAMLSLPSALLGSH